VGLDLRTNEIKRLLDKWPTTSFAWAPDSKHIAASPTAYYDADSPLVALDVRTGDITDLGVKGAEPSWSPDGAFIAYTSGPRRLRTRNGGRFDGAGVYRPLFCLELDTGQVRQLTRRGEGTLSPRWSPDGTSIAYLHGPPAGVRNSREREKAPVELRLVSRGGGLPKVLYRAQDTRTGQYPVWHPDFEWLPDGKNLLFLGPEAFVVVAADGSGAKRTVAVDIQASPLSETEMKDTEALVKTLREIRWEMSPQVWAAFFDGDLQTGKRIENEIAETYRGLPSRYPAAGLLQAECDLRAERAFAAASITPAENERAQADSRLFYIVFLLGRYLQQEGRRYPPSLEALREWAMTYEWGLNQIKNTDKERKWRIFHVPGAPGGWDDVSFDYAPPDEERGTPPMLEYRYLADVILRVDLTRPAYDEPGFMSAPITAVPK